MIILLERQTTQNPLLYNLHQVLIAVACILLWKAIILLTRWHLSDTEIMAAYRRPQLFWPSGAVCPGLISKSDVGCVAQLVGFRHPIICVHLKAYPRI